MSSPGKRPGDLVIRQNRRKGAGEWCSDDSTRIRTDATSQKPDRAKRRLPLRALNDQDFRGRGGSQRSSTHARTRDLVAELTAPDVIGRTRQTLTATQARDTRAIRRKKPALTAFRAKCLKKAHGGQEAWVQVRAEYGQWRVGASNFERMLSGFRPPVESATS